MTPHAKVPRSRRVLLLVDFINPLDFPGGEKLAPGALRAARATVKLRDRLDRDKVAVVYANDNYGVWQSDFHSIVAQCIGKEGESGEIARLLAPRAMDITLLKPRHSAFFGSALELLLDEMGAEELVLAGVASDICVQMTAADAFLRNYRVWVPADCVAAETAAAKAGSIKYMRDVLRCDVRPSTAAIPFGGGAAKGGRANASRSGEKTPGSGGKSADGSRRSGAGRPADAGGRKGAGKPRGNPRKDAGTRSAA